MNSTSSSRIIEDGTEIFTISLPFGRPTPVSFMPSGTSWVPPPIPGSAQDVLFGADDVPLYSIPAHEVLWCSSSAYVQDVEYGAYCLARGGILDGDKANMDQNSIKENYMSGLHTLIRLSLGGMEEKAIRAEKKEEEPRAARCVLENSLAASEERGQKTEQELRMAQ
ncbi:hypothetical protein O6P43_013200 [Quillaja saponaria]|uniref:Uncharacterized protein n=1 Tax=Quillaja saponaria TaxID=32244 RepID=A0AAD7M3D3_QUISA|nr:hypothetical protein O6P43_013200 [Quillaja saponaria]